jgi:hypothetical protein
MISSARLWLCLFGLTLAVPGGAHAQRANGVTDPRVAAVRSSLERTLADAEAEGLPSAWLRDKVAEGLAKHASPGRIVQAVEALHRRMQTADAIEARLPLGGSDRPRTLLRALVDALAAGAPPEGLERLVQFVSTATRTRDTTRRAALTVAELEERQLSPVVALELTSRAFRDNGRAGLAALRSTARSTPPERLEATLRRAASNGRRPSRQVGPSVDRSMGHAGGPPHDNAFGQGRGRGEGRGMRP